MLEKSTYYVLDAQGNQLSMYEHEVDQQAVNYTLAERNIYGSSRLGRNGHKVDLYTADLENPVNSVLGEKYYELSNHLGNVLAVINDVKYPVASGTTVDYFEVALVSVNDYSPFGVQLDGRTHQSDEYRYGFQEEEKDDEIKGEGNSYTTEFRQYDPRVARWLSLDPITHHHFSPYNGFDNNPIYYIDPNGGNAGDYYTEDDEFIGSDGVDDGLKHTISKEDFKANISFAKIPELNKANLSDFVTKTEVNINDKSINILRNGNSTEENSNLITMNEFLEAVPEAGKLFATVEGGLKYKEFDITLTDTDVKALKGGKLIMSKLGLAGDFLSGAMLIADFANEGATAENFEKAAWLAGDIAADAALASGVPIVMVAGGVYYLAKWAAQSNSGIQYHEPTPIPQDVLFEQDNTKVMNGY